MQPILVKWCRLYCNLSQKELAELIGVHQTLVSKIEEGTVPLKQETEHKLLEVFAEMGMDTETILKVKQVLNEIKKG